MVLDPAALNEARWAACNTRWDEGCVPTMEKAAEVADNAVRAYLDAISRGTEQQEPTSP